MSETRHPFSSELGGLNWTKFEKDIGQSSRLYKFVLDTTEA